MDLPRTRALLPRVEWRESSPSTNAELRELVAREPGLPNGTLLATADQTAGRGRLGRGWVTPPGTSIAASLLLRGPGIREVSAALGPGWTPLIAGSAVTDALQSRFGADSGLRVGVKWPNDVHVRDEDDAIAGRPGRKLCGILCEMLPDGSVIVGTGLNLLIPEWELPTDRASSLLAAGADVGGAETLDSDAGRVLADEILAAVTGGLLRLVERASQDPGAVRTRVLRHSLTLGSEVRVHLADRVIDGRARTLSDDGSLVVDLPTGGELVVSAGDVEHLR